MFIRRSQNCRNLNLLLPTYHLSLYKNQVSQTNLIHHMLFRHQFTERMRENLMRLLLYALELPVESHAPAVFFLFVYACPYGVKFFFVCGKLWVVLD